MTTIDASTNQAVVPERARWFTHDRFGLFIHWGIYSAKVRFARFLHNGSRIRFHDGTIAGSHTTPSGVTSDVLTLELPSQRPDVLIPVIELYLREE